MGKLLILGNSSGGLYEFRNELMLEMLQHHEVYISVPDEKRTKELEEEGCHIIKTHINRRGMNPVQDMGLVKSYMQLIGMVKPDLILTYTIKPNIYGGLCANMLRVPYITNITGLGTTFERGGMVKKLVVFLYRVALAKAVCVFFQNEDNKKIFEEHRIQGKKSRLIPGSGVNIYLHKEKPQPNNEKPRFLYVGRIMKEKGIDEYLYAAKVYQKEAEFGIIGYYEEEYEEIIKDMGKDGLIQFYGYQNDVDSFYEKSDAIIVPSYHEGMSNVVLEAASCGRPVLASYISGCKEAIDHRKTGFLFEPRNSQSLVDSIGELLKLSAKDREKMGQRARKKMEREFNRKLVVEAYMDEIEEILYETY
ncbi:MAG: glycosyltransferase family 4 protein [Eubacteriales bacterium]